MSTQIELCESLITFGVGCASETLLQAIGARDSSVFVVSQPPVWKWYGSQLESWLGRQSIVADVYLAPDGEDAKSLAELGKILEWLARRQADRHGLVIVLGGGVVGDLAGFAAATFMRGMDWIYLPTTLLAQQDASIGGKVGVNLPQGKNLVGNFWAPRQVIIDPAYLKTLPRRHLRSGYMELLKHGMLDGEPLYRSVLAMDPDSDDWSQYSDLLVAGIRVKARIVAQDPREEHKRRLLNLGHTFGHALEHWSDFRLIHGEAVGFGLVFATLLARRRGSLFDWSEMHAGIVKRLGTLDSSPLEWEGLRSFLAVDKKNRSGQMTWVIPRAPGDVILDATVPEHQLREVFHAWKKRVCP